MNNTTRSIPAPTCINGEQHYLTKTDFPFYLQCGKCGERYFIISESAAKQLGIVFIDDLNEDVVIDEQEESDFEL